MVDIAIAMMEPENEGNIGAVARAMGNFALSKLYLINPKIHIGINSRKMAAHAQSILDNAIILSNIASLKEEYDLLYGTTAILAKRPSNIKRNVLKPDDFAKLVSKIKGKVIILLGRESSGLSNEELEYCDAVITIPACEDYPTLNVATASAILFYELYKNNTEIKGLPLMNKRTKKLLLEKFLAVISQTNLPAYKKKLVGKAFKNILGKSIITKKEGSLLITALNRVEKELTIRAEKNW
ncbi:MAG: TrmJ/YjtD family RNA methyltransferase [Nitrososphaeria archaeon]